MLDTGRDEPRARQLIDGLFAFVGLLSPEGTLLEANLAALEAAGLHAEQVIGLPFWETWWWSASPYEQARLRQAVERAARGERVRYDAEVRLSEGRSIVIDFQLAPLMSAEGGVTHLVPSGVDVTERRRAEDVLAGIVENAPIGFAHLDRELRFIRINAEMAAINGIPVESHIGRTPMDLLPELPPESYLPVFEDALAGSTSEVEITGSTPGVHDGPRTWLERVYPLRDRAGNIVGVGVFALDITERRRSIEALQRSLLPRRLPVIARADLAARYHTASGALDVGGDFYEVLAERPGFACAAFIGDVCGRGVEAAALTSLARHSALPLIENDPCSPAAVLARLNRIILDHVSEGSMRFITMALAVMCRKGLDLGVRLVLAGHPRPIVVRRGGAAGEIGVPGNFLGVFPEPSLHEYRLALGPGDSLVLYTDGFDEARSPQGAFFGVEHIIAAAASAAGRGAGPIAEAIERDLSLFTQGAAAADDRALLVIAVPT